MLQPAPVDCPFFLRRCARPFFWALALLSPRRERSRRAFVSLPCSRVGVSLDSCRGDVESMGLRRECTEASFRNSHIDRLRHCPSSSSLPTARVRTRSTPPYGVERSLLLRAFTTR